MNNEISSKSLSLSSVDATLAAIIPDTPIVSIAGSTLSEITTTTTSTTTTPTPTPTSNETNRADISSSSSSSAEATIEQQPPSMSGASQKITGIATNRAAATAPVSVTVSAKLTSTSISTTTSTSTSTPQTDNNTTATSNDLDAINNVVDEEPASTPSIVSASLNTSITTENIDGASNSQHHERITKNHQITSSNTTDELSSIGNNNTTGATTKSSQSLTGNTKSETNTTDKKSKDSELWEEEKFTNLDDQNLKLLLEEAYSYRSPTDKENKSELFLSLLEKAENEKEDITLCRMPTSSRLKRISYTTHGNHLQQNHHNHHQRHKHGGSLQDLDEAVRNESILDPDYIFSSSCGQRNRRNNHNSRQKKYSTVSSRQREGGSLPNNVNFTNCARLFGGGGVGGIGGNAVGDVAGLTPIEQFPFMHEMNTVCSGTIASNTVASGGAPASSNANSASDSTNNNSNNTTTGNGCKQRRNAARTNLMSSAATSSIGAASGASNNEGEQMVGQPIGVLIGGQVITQRSSNTSMAANIGNEAAANSSTFNTGNRTLKDTICSVNVSDCVIEMGETILDVQQQQRIMQSKSQEGRVFYDRLENVDVMPRANMMTTIPARTNYAPNTANAYVDDKVHFTALRNYNPCAAATASGGGGAGGTKPIQSGAVDTKYLPLGDDYKAYKSVLAIADKEDMREVDENGNAVTEPFSVNTTTTHAAATGTVYNSINVTTNAPVISGAQASASAGSGTSSSSAQATKSKSKKQPKQERNVTTVNLETVAGYRGFDPVEKLVEYIESSTGGDDSKLSKQKKERKKQEKQDKHNNKIKKSNSLEELRSCAKMEVDELKRTAATTESNVMMRNKGKGGGAKNNSSSVADINKNFDSNNVGSGSSSSNTNSAVVTKEKSGNASAVISTNRKGERRSWGTEELQYLGDANSVANNIAIVTTQSASDEKIKDKDKERKSKNRESQKDDKDNKPKSEKVEKNDTEIINSQTVLPNTITTVKANVVDKSEKQQQQQPQPQPQQQQHIDKAEKRKKGDIQQTKSSIAGNIIAETTVPVVDILAMESLLPETAEFHVVTKKKKTKKQRSPIEETNGNNNNPNSKSNNNFVNAANLKGGNTNQSNRFNNAKSNTNEHFSNGNHYQHHNSNNNNNHHHNQQSQQQQHHHHQQQQQQQQQHQNQQQNQQKNDKSRRKSTSSVPPSEKSDSSDLDSVHSLPIEKAAKVSGGGAASSNPNATTKNANANAKQARQSSKNNTAGGVATAMSQPQKAPQVQQLPTPFSYAEIAKEAKSLKATISVTANTVNNNNNTEQAENISSQPHQQQQQQQTHPPATSTDEPKTTLARSQQSATHSAATGSITSATTSTPPSSSAGLTHSTNHHSNHHSNHPTKPHKVKKSMAKPDFPALGSASEVAVAASAARADIFAKAVLNSSQPPIAVPNPQQANENVTLLTAPKSTITEQPKEASHQQHPPQQHTPLVQQHQQQHSQQQQHQHQQQQYQQQQQTLQKSKSVDPEASNNVAINVNNKNYSNTMDHQQYPALKTVKRHSASNFSTLPPSIATTTQSTTNAGQQPPPQQQQHSMNSIPTPINFAAAARQTLITKNNPNIEMLPTTSTETTTSNVTTATTTAAMPKKNTAPVKEKAIVGSSNVSSPNTASPNENYNKKNKRDKQQQQQQQTVTSVNLSRKSTAATQTSVAQPNVVSKSSTRSTVVIPSAISTSAVSSMPQSLIITAINRPAVIILNDDAVGISSDFTFGDFNEDELHFFDDENEEYTTATGTATATNDELMEVHSLPPQLTSSSPRSCSLSVGSLQQLNDSVGNQQQADDIILTSSDVTLSPNNSVSIPANDNQQQHNNSGGAAGIASSGNTSNSSSHCIANASEQSNYSADSGIYNSAAKANESAVVVDVTTNVNTFLQQHISVMNNNPIANDMDNLMTEMTETQPQAPRQHQQQQLETCNEIESVIFAAARRAATQQQQQQQQHPQLQHQQMSHTKCSASSTTNANYQHSNSNSSSFSSSSSVDGGMNKYYSAAQSPPPSTQPTQQQQLQQQQQVHYYNRQAYPPYTTPVQHQQQMYPQNYNMLATSHHHQGIVAPVNMMYSRSNSDCDDEYVSPPPPPGTYMVKIQNKEYDLHYLPPNNSTNVDSQNELIVDYVSSVWNDVCNSKYTRIYDGQ